jgi:hypothetical protein
MPRRHLRRCHCILDHLNGAGVRYVLVGGIALIRHGVVRATRDIDAVFDPDTSNVERIRVLVDRWGIDLLYLAQVGEPTPGLEPGTPSLRT